MYVSIDIETTGLNPETCQIIEIGAVCGSESYQCYVDNGLMRGEAYALSMHAIILRRIATKEKGHLYLEPNEIAKHFGDWLATIGIIGKMTVAGYNFATFDKVFLDKLPGWHNIQIRHRVIDVGTLYWDSQVDGDVLPDLKTCMERADLWGSIEPSALADAVLTQRLIERKIK